jgi:CheY-like chemotaxis protein
MEKHILIIDDEKITLRYYIQELELEGYSVEVISRASECRRLIDSQTFTLPDMFVVDIMMSPQGIYDKSKTEDGLLTGLYLARDIRKQYQDTPILIWSVTPFPELVDQAKRLAKSLNNCAFIRKSDYLPVDFVEFVNSYFSNSGFKSGFFRTLWDSLLLEPNFSGVGIDIKKLKR